MTQGRLRVVAAALIGLVTLAAVFIWVRDGAGDVSASAAAQTVDGPVASAAAPGAGASADLGTGLASAMTPQTVPPVTVDAPVDAPVVEPSPTPIAAPATDPTTTTTLTSVQPVVTSAIGARALQLIRYPWTKLGYQIAFHGPKAGFFGLTDCSTHHIDIYVAEGQTAAQVAYVTAFEIGHAIDCSNQVPGHQAEWPALRGFHYAGAWYPSCSCAEDGFPSGDFAEVFARWQVGAAYPWRSRLAPAPTAAQMVTLVPLFG